MWNFLIARAGEDGVRFEFAVMEIQDLRQSSSWVAAVSILEEFIPKFDPSHFIGIKKIVLLDNDYRNEKKEPAAARYVQIKGTNFANIEIFLDRYSELPEEAKKSRMFLTWYLLKSVAHELYHHRIRGQKKIRRPNEKKEQRDADQWAEKTLGPIFVAVYPKNPHQKEWELIARKIEEHRGKKSNQPLEPTARSSGE